MIGTDDSNWQPRVWQLLPGHVTGYVEWHAGAPGRGRGKMLMHAALAWLGLAWPGLLTCMGREGLSAAAARCCCAPRCCLWAAGSKRGRAVGGKDGRGRSSGWQAGSAVSGNQGIQGDESACMQGSRQGTMASQAGLRVSHPPTHPPDGSCTGSRMSPPSSGSSNSSAGVGTAGTAGTTRHGWESLEGLRAGRSGQCKIGNAKPPHPTLPTHPPCRLPTHLAHPRRPPPPRPQTP